MGRRKKEGGMSSKAMAMRLQEIPKYLQQTLTVANAKSAMDAYRVKYIETSSPMPLYHVMGYGFIASYALSWPWEYAHMQHEAELAKKGVRTEKRKTYICILHQRSQSSLSSTVLVACRVWGGAVTSWCILCFKLFSPYVRTSICEHAQAAMSCHLMM